MPDASKVSMVPVATEASPLLIDRNRSPSGTRHIRWSHGSYVGRKCVSTSYPSGSILAFSRRIIRRTGPGQRCEAWKSSVAWATFFQRVTM